jgi:hypothetical protein
MGEEMSTIALYLAGLAGSFTFLIGVGWQAAAASDTDACDFGSYSAAEIRISIHRSMLSQNKC